MPKGPKGQKRPADVIGNAIKVAKIATGEIDEEHVKQEAPTESAAAAAQLGRLGGKARAKKLSPAARQAIAKNAAATRWREKKPKKS